MRSVAWRVAGALVLVTAGCTAIAGEGDAHRADRRDVVLPQTAPEAEPPRVRGVAPLAPTTVPKPVPMPLVMPSEPGPVPMPLVKPAQPGPVPMPRVHRPEPEPDALPPDFSAGAP